MSNLMRHRDVLRDQQGFTLGETMVSLLILGVVSLALAAGIALAVHYYGSVTQQASARTLCSTLQTTVADELAYCSTINLGTQVSEGRYEVTGVFAPHYGGISDTMGGLFYQVDGRVVFGSETDYEPLLGNPAYPDGLQAGVKIEYYDQTHDYFHVVLSVEDAAGGELITQTFDVISVNARTMASQ